jgi:NADPH-dependent 2,4-dienoyl-CoA reductase/sulfur reductase-like enzyme/rhodanese-related sulfurtransferase
MARYLIVGGVAGGATAAARLRRLDEKAEIIVFERGGYVSFANCGLPYYIGRVIPDRRRLFVQTPQGFRNRFNIDVRVNAEVTGINRTDRTVNVKNLSNGEAYREKYDRLILAPGAEPLRPTIPGINSDGIFTLRNISDTDRIYAFLNDKKPKSAVIVGGGSIGLEMAENILNLGIQVTIVEMADQVLAFLDYEMAAEVHQHIRVKGVELLLKDGVKSFDIKNNMITTRLSSGRDITSGIVILSIGVRPDVSLAKDAGLRIGPRGGIAVNEHLQTSDPEIYAVGDAIEFANPITSQAVITYLAGPANRQGRLAADNIVTGNTKKYGGSVATAVVKVFDLTVASTGVSEKSLKADKIPHSTSITHSESHATYYPGASEMSIKIIFSPDRGILLGAQVIGRDGVDKRNDVLSAFIGMKGSIYNLLEFEQSYAPPFSSAKDPITIAASVAENILSGLVKIIKWNEIQKLDPAKIVLLDVRTQKEHRAGSIEGSMNIPIDDLRNSLGSIPKDKIIVTYCAVGQRAYIASRILKQHGYNTVFNLSGGYKTYSMVHQFAVDTDDGRYL